MPKIVVVSPNLQILTHTACQGHLGKWVVTALEPRTPLLCIELQGMIENGTEYRVGGLLPRLYRWVNIKTGETHMHACGHLADVETITFYLGASQ